MSLWTTHNCYNNTDFVQLYTDYSVNTDFEKTTQGSDNSQSHFAVSLPFDLDSLSNLHQSDSKPVCATKSWYLRHTEC